MYTIYTYKCMVLANPMQVQALKYVYRGRKQKPVQAVKNHSPLNYEKNSLW
jgi:hypothetical protein